MATPRWSLTRPGSAYTFEINPNAQTSPTRNRPVAWARTLEGYSGTRAANLPTQWEFSGIIRSQQQYDVLVSWVNAREKATVTTDLGQQFEVRLQKFSSETAQRRQAPNRHLYSVSCLILSTAVSSSGTGNIQDSSYTGGDVSVGGSVGTTPDVGGFPPVDTTPIGGTPSTGGTGGTGGTAGNVVPTNAYATPGDGVIHVFWTAATGTFDSYDVQLTNTSTNATTLTTGIVSGATSADIPATNGATYTAQVRTSTGSTKGTFSTATNSVTPAATQTGGGSTTPVPSTDKILATHYFVPYPISFRGSAGGQIYDDTGQYYDNEYLRIGGVRSGGWGAFLRDRPPAAPVLPAASYPFTDANMYKAWVEDQKIEINRIKAAGLNSTFIDLLSFDNFNDRNWRLVHAHMDAATAIDPSFRVFPMIDMSGPLGTTCTPTQAVNALKDLVNLPAMGKIGGVPTFIPFTPETRDQNFWDQVDAGLVGAGVTNYQWIWCVQQWGGLSTWAARSRTYGMSAWGGRNPAYALSERPRGSQAHAAGKKWIQTLAIQDQRFSTGEIYDEAVGSQLLREFWQSARESGADGFQAITWNDYSESTQFSPSRNNSDSWGALNRYYLNWFVTGTKPVPTNDFAVIIHRLHHSQATLPAGRTRMSLRSGSTPTVNIVEVTTWLKADAQIVATIGGAVQPAYTATAGEFTKQFPISVSTSGAPSILINRNSASVLSLTSRNAITTTPQQEDLGYYATHVVA